MAYTLRDSNRSETLQTAEALGLDCVRFGVAPGVSSNGKPPVRIFLGTETAQLRAQRIFLYSIEKHRDPARAYYVYLMQDLPGFDRRGWRTGFTQYRFAIPELAGGAGRAIYNDVDQIYLADPAALFDLELHGCGYRAVAANDTSVMVMDCARMLPRWNLAAAQTQGKRALVDAPAAEPGLWGHLDGAWNARDFEYRAQSSKLLHYTTLHLQPWRPSPHKYSYHTHPLGILWHRLECEADEARYQPFGRERPSASYRRLLSEGIAPRIPAPGENVVVHEGLERLPAQDRPWYLEALFAAALRSLSLRVDLRSSPAGDKESPAAAVGAEQAWREALAEAAERRPGVAWELLLLDSAGERRFAYRPQSAPPRVWILLGPHAGDNRQLTALAQALGWPYETRSLAFRRLWLLPTWLQGASRLLLDVRRSQRLVPPWPDLLLAAGRRSAPVARWIRRRSNGATRLVHLGRPQTPLAAFDLVVTTPQYGLPGRENVLHNLLPLNRPESASACARAAWQPRLAQLPRPWIGLLAGGNSSSSRLDAASAQALRAQAEALARERGGSLLIATSPRTPAAAAEALTTACNVPAVGYRWRPDDAENPYLVFLEQADELIVTGDSASMLAEACASGRPVHYAVLPRPRELRPTAALLLWLLERNRDRTGERGTPKQQKRWGRWRDGLIAGGVLRMPRDLRALHEALRWSGLAQPLGAGQALATPARSDDLARTVRAVRRLLLRGREQS